MFLKPVLPFVFLMPFLSFRGDALRLVAVVTCVTSLSRVSFNSTNVCLSVRVRVCVSDSGVRCLLPAFAFLCLGYASLFLCRSHFFIENLKF